jgi:hypothetical protein
MVIYEADLNEIRNYYSMGNIPFNGLPTLRVQNEVGIRAPPKNLMALLH